MTEAMKVLVAAIVGAVIAPIVERAFNLSQDAAGSIGVLSFFVLVLLLLFFSIIRDQRDRRAVLSWLLVGLMTILVFLSSFFLDFPYSFPPRIFSSEEVRNASGKRLHVKTGEVFKVAESNPVYFEEWIMEKDAKIIFADEVKNWRITALKATFEENIVIEGRGTNGSDGASGTPGITGGDCRSGGQGGGGVDGKDGTAGVNITMKVAIRHLEDLTIDIRGGDGGNGGPGGNGGGGGKADCSSNCRGGDGGPGGDGGNGKNGGQGGNFILEYIFLDDKDRQLQEQTDIRILNAGGQPGEKGQPGSGGGGGPGKKCFGFKKGGGNGGGTGSPGQVGSLRDTGEKQLTQDTGSKRLPPWAVIVLLGWSIVGVAIIFSRFFPARRRGQGD